MPIAGFDCHCHLDLYKDPTAILRDLNGASISTFAVTTTPRAFKGNLQRFGSSSLVRVGLGIHPELAHTREANMRMFHELLPAASLVGEIGLDKRPRNRATFSQQQAVFDEVLSAVQLSDRPRILSVHSAGAVTPVLARLELLSDTRIKKIMHWFTGSLGELQRAVDLNCYFSVNQAMVETDRGKSLIRKIPPNQLLAETDGPFTSVSGRPAVPSDVLLLAGSLAKEIHLTELETRQLLVRNALTAISDL